MKFTIKSILLILLLAICLGTLLHFSNRNEYEILKPEVIHYNEDKSSWELIMDVKKQVFKNIEKHWQKKHTHERN
jgi:hypothetical protein